MSTTKKIALVTGASRGIGRATAKALAAEGVHVIAHYGSSRAEAESLVEEIRKAGRTAASVPTSPPWMARKSSQPM